LKSITTLLLRTMTAFPRTNLSIFVHDFLSAAWGVADGCDISPYGRVYFPHSLGIFYQAITQYLGFPHYGGGL
jgi:hypothetical protein